MQPTPFISGLLIMLFATSTYSATTPTSSLQLAREQVIKQYVLDLQKADYKDITQLFEKNGTVISTSKGKIDAKEFFYGFLSNIKEAHTELKQTFINQLDEDGLAVRFHFTFTLKDGEVGDGEYVDEFIFTNNATKLSGVYMFENLKFKDESKV